MLSWILLGAEKELGLTSTQQGLIASITLVGTTFGAMIGGALGDIIGRKKSLIVALLVSTIFNLLSAVSFHWMVIVVMRFFQAGGSAMVMVIGKVYIAETHPRSCRGEHAVLTDSASSQGASLIAINNYLYIPANDMLFLQYF